MFIILGIIIKYHNEGVGCYVSGPSTADGGLNSAKTVGKTKILPKIYQGILLPILVSILSLP